MKNSIIYGLSILSIALLFSCEEIGLTVSEIENPEKGKEKTEDAVIVKEYVIETGEHYSNLSSFEKQELEELNFSVLFDSSAIYHTTDPANQGDINKLYGLADCNGFHQKNSARFGWRWYNERLEILAYAYVNGIREYEYIGTVELNEYHDYRIGFEDERYVFSLDSAKIDLPRSCYNKAKGYKLFPYFGGDETAPHDIRILIRPHVK